MICKYFLLYLFFTSSGLTCSTNSQLTAKKVKQKDSDFEGYIILDVKTFTNVDSNGTPQESIRRHDSILLSAHRKMYIKNNCLIDILANINLNDGVYIKTDTLSYDFYDLLKQKYVLFEKLSTDAKIIKRGSMAEGGSFSNSPQFDPAKDIVDSTWKLTDTTINGKRHGVINFILTDITDSLDREFAKRSKYWVDHETKNFPIQLSFMLSKKVNGSFVYKMQNPFPDGKTVMITSFDFQPAKLPDTLTRIFERWTRIARE